MPDENRFAGLSEAVDEDEESSDDPADGDSQVEEIEEGESAGTEESVGSENGPDVPDGEDIPDGVDIPDSSNIPNSLDSPNIVKSADVVDSEGSRSVSSNAGGEPSRNSASTDVETEDMNGINAVDDTDEAGSVDAEESESDTNSSNIVKSADIVDGADIPDSANIPESVDRSELDCDDDSTSADAGSAFGFDDTEQHSVYVRPDAWQKFEDAEALVNARLRAEHDVRDLAGREFHDAVLRVASEHEDELVEAILAARKEE